MSYNLVFIIALIIWTFFILRCKKPCIIILVHIYITHELLRFFIIYHIIARIELRPADIQKFIENGIKDKVSEKLHKLGFKYVSLDLDGYRLGSMNEVLNRQERGNNGGSSL